MPKYIPALTVIQKDILLLTKIMMAHKNFWKKDTESCAIIVQRCPISGYSIKEGMTDKTNDINL